MTASTATATATATADEVTPYASKALIASTAGYAMDGFDFLILGFMLTAIRADLGLSQSEAASLATWTLLGAVAGGIGFGILSDHLGRVRVLTWTILLFAVFTGLSALARGYWDLALYRAVAGLGLGGEFGIGMALAAALVTPLLLPAIGWRGMFVVGLLPAFASFLIRRAVGEPPLFVERARTTRTMAPLRLLVKDAATAKISLGMLILCSVQNFGYYGIMIWMPGYLARQFGFGLPQAAVWTFVTILGMAFGIWLFGELADRIGRKPVFLAYQAGAAVMVVVYSQLKDPTAALVGGAVMGMFVNGMLGGYGALMSELYPTEARATAQNVLFNLGRAVGGFGPLVIGALASAYSWQVAIALLAAIYVVDMLATALLIPERKGVALE